MSQEGWEEVSYSYNRVTEKLKVTGGYIYHTKDYMTNMENRVSQITTAMCFVPCKHED